MGVFSKLKNIFYDEVEVDEPAKEIKIDKPVKKEIVEKPRVEEIKVVRQEEKREEPKREETPKEMIILVMKEIYLGVKEHLILHNLMMMK